VREGGGHPYVEDDEIGLVVSNRRPQPVCVAERSDDLMPTVLEEPPEALAQQHLVLGDHDAHGSSAVSVVPRRCSLSMRSVPPWAATRSERPRSPEPAAGVAPPTPSSATETTSRPLTRPALRTILVAFACLTALVRPSQAMK